MSRKKWLSIKLILLILIFITLTVGTVNYFRLKRQSSEVGEEQVFSDVEKIVVESISLPVNIYESDVAEVTIKDHSRIYGLRTGKANSIEQENGLVSIKQEKKISFLSFVSGEIIIEVPKGSILEYDINSISGNLNHNAMSKETLRATSISGAVKIHQGSENVSVKTTSGSVKIYAPFQEVSVNSVSGSSRILANQDSNKVFSSTISGSTSIQLENISGYELDYSTTSGNVKDAYEGINYSKSGNATIGDASLKINVSSISGSIKIEDWNN